MHLKEIKGIDKLSFIGDYPGYPAAERYVYTIKKKFCDNKYDENGKVQIYFTDNYPDRVRNSFGIHFYTPLFYMNNTRFMCFGELVNLYFNDLGKEEVHKNIKLIEQLGLI